MALCSRSTNFKKMFRYLDNVEDTAGGRLYQYNEDDFRFEFKFLSNYEIAWIHINMKKSSCQLKKLHFDFVET